MSNEILSIVVLVVFVVFGGLRSARLSLAPVAFSTNGAPVVANTRRRSVKGVAQPVDLQRGHCPCGAVCCVVDPGGARSALTSELNSGSRASRARLSWTEA